MTRTPMKRARRVYLELTLMKRAWKVYLELTPMKRARKAYLELTPMKKTRKVYLELIPMKKIRKINLTMMMMMMIAILGKILRRNLKQKVKNLRSRSRRKKRDTRAQFVSSNTPTNSCTSILSSKRQYAEIVLKSITYANGQKTRTAMITIAAGLQRRVMTCGFVILALEHMSRKLSAGTWAKNISRNTKMLRVGNALYVLRSSWIRSRKIGENMERRRKKKRRRRENQM
mmetsp:Transcript_7183/g.11282  ORF Transcript_7183/g.11282 Transcript_7183/m.11282 type:complete len:230 (+) Transcript_7183:1345-2034(+)